MIKSATGLKAKVRNISKGDSKTAQAIIRIFFMERFLERISFSKYRDQFILKGGMLVSSLIGINLRTTIDIDTTVKALPIRQAFAATCKKRETIFSKEKVDTELKNLSQSKEIEEMWKQFKSKNCFVENIQYCDVIKTISDLILNIYG